MKNVRGVQERSALSQRGVMITVRGAISLVICLGTAVASAGCIGTNLTMQPGDSLPATVHASTPFNTEAIREEIIRATNEERAKNGRPALRVDSILMEVANRRARALAGSYSHYGPNGERLWEIEAQQGGYPGQVGENIGKQPLTFGITGQELIAGWMNSAAHRANLLSDRYTAIGVGVYYASQYQMLYRVQVFGTQ